MLYAPGIYVTLPLAARLNVSIPFGPYTLTHVVKLCSDGVCTGALAAQSFEDPVQTDGFFGSFSGHFPYGFNVVPDN